MTLTDDPAWEGLLRGIAAASVPTSGPTGAPPLPVGARLGRFELRALLGAGGFGVVYRAHDTVLGRDVALKLPWRRDAEASRGFLEEARTGASLADPHLVSVYDVGERDGFPFIALELVQGRSLRSLLEPGALSLDEARPLLRGVARALRAVHARGWVHLDVKPDNVVVGDDGSVKLLDFGVAQPTGTTRSSGGTPDYAPPEATSPGPRDARFDTFAFGVLAQEVLLGERSTRPLARLARLGSVGALIRQCLAAEADARPASGEALVAVLEAPPRRRWAAAWLGAGLALAGLLVVLQVRRGSQSVSLQRQHLRLTANRVDRPIIAAALSADGLRVLSADDEGWGLFAVDAPTRARRVELPEGGEPGTVRALPDGSWVLGAHDGGTVLWRLDADGSNGSVVWRTASRTADVGPAGEVVEVDDERLTVHRRGETLVRAARERETFLYAAFSPDGRHLVLARQQFQRSGWVRCVEAVVTADLEVTWAHCSERLTQPWMPVVAAWHPEGIAWVEAEAPSAGSGVSILLQPLSREGRASGAVRRIDAIDDETVSGLSISQTGALLTLRHEVKRTTERLVGATLTPMSVSDFDERPSAWSGDGTLWRTQVRARVPSVVGTTSTGDVVRLPVGSWQSAALAVDDQLVAWTTSGPVDGGLATWDLVRVFRDGGVERIALPGRLDEAISLSRNVPPRAEVHCAGAHEPCVLGWPDEAYVFYALGFAGSPRRLFSVPDLRERYGRWTLTDRATVLVTDGRGQLVERDLEGQTLAVRPLEAFETVYALASTPGRTLVSGPLRQTGRYRLVALDDDGGTTVLFEDAQRAITDIIPGPRGGLALGVRVIDTDLWLSRELFSP